jgi:hypothetical protein
MTLLGSRLTGCAALLALVLPSGSYGGWQDLIEPLEGLAGSGEETGLSQEDLASGLKEALRVGTGRAIEHLGRDGGFLNDSQVRIPLPSALQTLEQGLRAGGQGAIADNFVTTMNRAAERAVPETAAILGKAIASMTLDDAKAILTGPDDAATEYFRKSSRGRLAEAILPIVSSATEQAGVTSAYKRFMGSSAGGLFSRFTGGGDLDIDRYVTEKALDGLFLKLADEERLIREDPAARSTELLQNVFGTPGT